MKTLKKLTLFLAVVLACLVTVVACEEGKPMEGALASFAVLFIATHALVGWQHYRAGVFRVELTFPFNEAGAPVGAQIAKGCLACPTGYAYTGDTALNALERVTNRILMEGVKDWRMPQFPLAGLPVRAASAQQMTGNKKIRHHVFYPDVHRAPWYNPTPVPTKFTVTRELIQQCRGDVAAARLIANANSIGCAPPRGPRGLSGKDAYFQDAATTVFELGPFCITDYLELMEFQRVLEAYKRGAINAAGMALEYEKMRRFVGMSRVNGSAVAGTSRPSFVSSTFGHVPDSPGSIEWLWAAIDNGIGGEVTPGTVIEVHVSTQLFRYWIEKYAADHDIVINLNEPASFQSQIQGYITRFDNAGGFLTQSLRTNRQIRITTTKEPVYVEVSRSGDAGEWDFQPYFVTELGDEPDTEAANGFRQAMNTAYGDACNFCDGEVKRLAEMIFIYAPSAFHYEAFPTNPLGTQIDSQVEVNLQRLWGATEIMWYFGVDVDEYFLRPMNTMLAGTGAPCFSNIDKTWFAGRIKTGLQFVEDDPRQMMTLLVAVPGQSSVITKSECCLPCDPPAAITITPAPARQPALCTDIPAGVTADDAPVGCFQAPRRMQFALPCVENRTASILFRRVGGVEGALSIPFAITEETATEGALATDHFDTPASPLLFPDGVDQVQMDIVLHPIHRTAGDPAFVTAKIVWDNAPVVVCDEDGATVDTNLCFILCNQLVDPADACPSAYCLQCAGQETVAESPA